FERFLEVRSGNNWTPPFHIPLSYSGWNVDNGGGGAGSLGTVKKFDSPDGSRSVAVKRFSTPFQTRDRAQLILRELNLLRTINHENIVHLIECYTVENGPTDMESIYHITDYCGEPLRRKIDAGQYSMDHAKKWTRELLRAVQHLHSNGVIHRNLQPDNICIDSCNKLTLIGFGNARTIDRRANMTALRGTQPYTSIEQLVDWRGAYDEKVDIWSVSAILCELITGQPFFISENQSATSLKVQIEFCGQIGQAVLNRIANEADRQNLDVYSRRYERKDFIAILRSRMLFNRSIGDVDILANEDSLRDFIEHTLQFDPDCRMPADRALPHSFLRTTAPWELVLPPNDDEALAALRQHIWREITEPTVRR
ncbi:hypothetical protein PENTCL1PPCAC_5529, partial [Pristionchus entomophagus]